MSEHPEVLWVVVRVERGIPMMAEVYADERAALCREQDWRRGMNLNSDETGVFAARVRSASEAAFPGGSSQGDPH